MLVPDPIVIVFSFWVGLLVNTKKFLSVALADRPVVVPSVDTYALAHKASNSTSMSYSPSGTK